MPKKISEKNYMSDENPTLVLCGLFRLEVDSTDNINTDNGVLIVA